MCQRLVCQKREFTVRSSSCEVKRSELKNEIFVRIVKLFVVDTVFVCQNLLYKEIQSNLFIEIS